MLEDICRTCMAEYDTGVVTTLTKKQQGNSLISIYHEYEANDLGNVNIMELLKQAIPQLTVEDDDMLPKNICESCLDVLTEIHEFQKKVLRVEQRLQEIIKLHCASLETSVDPLNNNKVEQAEGEEDLKIEIDETVTDNVTIPVRGLFTLIEKDGQIYEVYNDLGKCEEDTDGCSEQCDTDYPVGSTSTPLVDTAASKVRNKNENLTDVTFWKYIVPDKHDSTPALKEQISEGEVNSPLLRHKRKRLEKINRTLRTSNREIKKDIEISDKSTNRKEKCHNENVDGEKSIRPPTAISNMKNAAEVGILETEASDCNEVREEDDKEWEPPKHKTKRVKPKSIKDDNKPEGSRGLICNECGKRLKSRHNLNKHILIQHSAKTGQHVCPQCGLRLKTRTTLTRHVLRHARKDVPKSKERPYLCSVCGKSYPTTYSLKQHSERHGGLKYQCPECPKQFRSKTNLSSHKANMHSTARPHVCDICGASFKKPYSLRKHKINHEEKKHKCDYCDMKFSHIQQCRVHMRTHTGERPYKCKYCDRTYTQFSEMMKHLRVHIGDNVYRCELCPQGFPKMCELRIHFATHKDDDEETKLQNLKDLQAKIESEKTTAYQS